MNYSRIHNAYTYTYVYITRIFYVYFIYCGFSYYYITHYILSIFVSEIPLEKNLATQMILHISCAKFAYSAPNIGWGPSPRCDKQECRKSENDARSVHPPGYSIQSTCARATQTWETLQARRSRISIHASRFTTIPVRMHLDAARCTLPHLGVRMGYTGASPEMDGKTRQFREIIFALCVWNVTLRFATWFMCGVGFMVGCNKHVVEINNGSSGWV